MAELSQTEKQQMLHKKIRNMMSKLQGHFQGLTFSEIEH